MDASKLEQIKLKLGTWLETTVDEWKKVFFCDFSEQPLYLTV